MTHADRVTDRKFYSDTISDIIIIRIRCMCRYGFIVVEREDSYGKKAEHAIVTLGWNNVCQNGKPFLDCVELACFPETTNE